MLLKLDKECEDILNNLYYNFSKIEIVKEGSKLEYLWVLGYIERINISNLGEENKYLLQLSKNGVSYIQSNTKSYIRRIK